MVLIGLRGSGKSTVGQALAQQLGIPFVDLDDLVLAQFEGYSTVTAMWEALGEEVWRAAEEDLAHRLLERESDIRQALALGGGSPMIESVQTMLHHSKETNSPGKRIIIYLRGSATLLANRLRAQPGDRPALTKATNLTDEIREVLAQRDPIFLEIASHVIELEANEGINEVVGRILRALKTEQ